MHSFLNHPDVRNHKMMTDDQNMGRDETANIAVNYSRNRLVNPRTPIHIELDSIVDKKHFLSLKKLDHFALFPNNLYGGPGVGVGEPTSRFLE